MAFDKQDYKTKRKNGERGQGPKITGTFYPKGTEVDKKHPNAAGENLVRVKGKGMQYLSRKEARQIQRSHPATKKNYEHQKDTKGFSHVVNKPGMGRTTKGVKQYRLPGISNHTAHRERQIIRIAKREQPTNSEMQQEVQNA